MPYSKLHLYRWWRNSNCVDMQRACRPASQHNMVRPMQLAQAACTINTALACKHDCFNMHGAAGGMGFCCSVISESTSAVAGLLSIWQLGREGRRPVVGADTHSLFQDPQSKLVYA